MILPLLSVVSLLKAEKLPIVYPTSWLCTPCYAVPPQPVSSNVVIQAFFYPHFPYDITFMSQTGLQTPTKFPITIYFWKTLVGFSSNTIGHCCVSVLDVC